MQRRARARASAPVSFFLRTGSSRKRAAASLIVGFLSATAECSISAAVPVGRSNTSRRSLSASPTGSSSWLGGLRPKSRDEARSASAGPGSVDAELASFSVTSKRFSHLGHFIRLPALIRSGRFRTIPHFWHRMVRGMVSIARCLVPLSRHLPREARKLSPRRRPDHSDRFRPCGDIHLTFVMTFADRKTWSPSGNSWKTLQERDRKKGAIRVSKARPRHPSGNRGDGSQTDSQHLAELPEFSYFLRRRPLLMNIRRNLDSRANDVTEPKGPGLLLGEVPCRVMLGTSGDILRAQGRHVKSQGDEGPGWGLVPPAARLITEEVSLPIAVSVSP